MIDLSVNLGNIITIVVVGSGLIATFATMKSNIVILKDEMRSFKDEVKKLATVLIDVARQDERMSAMDRRMLSEGQRIDELRSTVGQLSSQRLDDVIQRFNRLMASEEQRKANLP